MLRDRISAWVNGSLGKPLARLSVSLRVAGDDVDEELKAFRAPFEGEEGSTMAELVEGLLQDETSQRTGLLTFKVKAYADVEGVGACETATESREGSAMGNSSRSSARGLIDRTLATVEQLASILVQQHQIIGRDSASVRQQGMEHDRIRMEMAKATEAIMNLNHVREMERRKQEADAAASGSLMSLAMGVVPTIAAHFAPGEVGKKITKHKILIDSIRADLRPEDYATLAKAFENRPGVLVKLKSLMDEEDGSAEVSEVAKSSEAPEVAGGQPSQGASPGAPVTPTTPQPEGKP